MNIKKILSLCAIFTCLNSCAEAQSNYSNDAPAYVIYNKSGKKISFSTMLNEISQKVDVCLFGEFHDDPISHWMELKLIKNLYKDKGDKLIVGAEMWERDQQLLLDEFLLDPDMSISTYQSYEKLWSNFTTDYKSILNFAKANNIKFVGTNVPRRYANIVSRNGIEKLDSLTDNAKSYLPPLPITIDLNNEFYESIADIFKESAGMMKKTSISNMVKAQALKDATMAYFLVKSMSKDSYMFHFHGELHSAFNSAIQFYLRQYAPELQVKTISVLKQDDVMKFDSDDSRADFNIVIPNDMCKTYVSE